MEAEARGDKQMMRKWVVRSLLVGLVAAGLLGCSNGVSGDDGDFLDDCRIEALCLYYDMEGPWGPTCLCEVTVEYIDPESGDSEWPDDLIVTVNTAELSFAALRESYLLATGPGWLQEGEPVTLSVSDGERTVLATADMPYAPGSLELVGGSWDASSIYSYNWLRWQNELIVGNEIALRVWAPTEPDGVLIGSFSFPFGDGEGSGVGNWQLTDYTSLDETVICEVFQVNHVIITETNHQASNLRVCAGVWGEWPVTARGAVVAAAMTGQPN